MEKPRRKFDKDSTSSTTSRQKKRKLCGLKISGLKTPKLWQKYAVALLFYSPIALPLRVMREGLGGARVGPKLQTTSHTRLPFFSLLSPLFTSRSRFVHIHKYTHSLPVPLFFPDRFLFSQERKTHSPKIWAHLKKRGG